MNSLLCGLRRASILVSACLAATGAGAVELNFMPGLVIGHTAGTGGVAATDFVETQGFRFETYQGRVLAINTYTGDGRNFGGLWDGGAFGVASPIRIARLDGGAFSAGSLAILDHAGYACWQNYCGRDGIGFQARPAAGGPRFTVARPFDGFNNTYDAFDLAALDARFASIDELILLNYESFILDRISLSPVPELPTAALAMLGLAALGLRRRA